MSLRELRLVDKRVLTRSVAVLSLLFLFLLPVPGQFRQPVAAMDEGVLLVYPERVLRGDLPHRDFETLYGPANPWFIGLAFKVLGPSLFAERAVGLIYRAAIVVALVLLAGSQGVAVAIVTGIIAVLVLNASAVPALAWFGGLGLASLGLLLLMDGRHQFLAGVLGGLALVFRLDLAVSVATPAAVFRSRRYVLGVLSGLAPYALHTLIAGPRSVLENQFLYSLYIGPTRRLPLPFGSSLLWLILVSTTLLGITAVRRWRQLDRAPAAMALFAIGLLPQAFQRADPWHLLMGGLFPIALLPSTLAAWVEPPRKTLALTFAVLMTAGGAAGFIVPPTFDQAMDSLRIRSLDTHRVSFQGRTIYLDRRSEAKELGKLVTAVETRANTSGRRLFVGPSDLRRTIYNDTFIYFLLPELTPATYFLEMSPGVSNRPGSRLAQDIASADLMILTHRWDSAFALEPNASRKLGPVDPQIIVQREFCLVSRYGPWDFLERCEA